ncbi:MAG TPA: PHP domain-containing protein, partial [Thermodesulfobacteriota bacterium]|nr:PHP domain-containing protein [Thermodesulfobacteriota bacterium]
MPLLKGNLHTHTTFSDGLLPVEEIVARYRALGYDFVAITDHDTAIKPAYWSAIPRSTPDFLIFAGVELTYPYLGGQHIGLVNGEEEKLYIFNHPNVFGLSARDVRAAIARVAGRIEIHAVETTHHGRYLPEYDVPEIPVQKVATDDAHGPEEVGRAWVEV